MSQVSTVGQVQWSQKITEETSVNILFYISSFLQTLTRSQPLSNGHYDSFSSFLPLPLLPLGAFPLQAEAAAVTAAELGAGAALTGSGPGSARGTSSAHGWHYY